MASLFGKKNGIKTVKAGSASAATTDSVPLVSSSKVSTSIPIGDLPADWKPTGSEDFSAAVPWHRWTIVVFCVIYLAGTISAMVSTTVLGHSFNTTVGDTLPLQQFKSREIPLDILFGADLIFLFFCYGLAYAINHFYSSLYFWMHHNHVHAHRLILDLVGLVAMYWALPQMFGMIKTTQLVLMMVAGAAGILLRYAAETINSHTVGESDKTGRPPVDWVVIIGGGVVMLAPAIIASVWAIELMQLEVANGGLRYTTITVWIVYAVAHIIFALTFALTYVKLDYYNELRNHTAYDLGYFFAYTTVLLVAYIICVIEAFAAHHVAHNPEIITFGPIVL